MAPPCRPRRLGLTGNIGAGKSTVAALLRARGLSVLDADEQARLVTAEPEVLAEISAAFPGVVAGGALNRAALAAQVFGDPERLARLNAIVHPRVRERMAALEAEATAGGAAWVVQDVPLLFENGLDATMDAVLVVDAPLETRLARLEARGLPRADALARQATRAGRQASPRRGRLGQRRRSPAVGGRPGHRPGAIGRADQRVTDEQAARAVLGGPVNRLGAGVGSVAYTDGARVVRLGTAGASRYVVDAAIRTALRAAGVPTPEPLGQGTLPGGRPYSVDALAAGDETPPAPDGWRDLGRALGVLHALPCRGFGLLNVDETGLVGAAITPPDGLRTRLPDVWPHGKTALEAQPHLLAAPDLAPLLRPLEQALRGVIALPAAPLHTDLHAGQLRWQGGRLAALLDFGDAAAGPSAWDAASLAYFHGWDVAEVAGLQPGPDAFLFGLLLAQHRARRAGDEVKLARAVAFARTCLDRLN